MNTFQLNCFLAVANSLNFARAAEQMNISQPAVTHQIQSLEIELGIKLFHRSTRSVKITLEGQIFLKDAQNIIIISERAKKRFKNPEERPTEFFSIGYGKDTQLTELSKALNQLKQLYSNIHPIVHEVSFRQLPYMIDDEQIDIGIGLKPADYKKNQVKYIELCKYPMMCICPKNHTISHKELITLQDLKTEKIILYKPDLENSEIAQFQWQLTQERSLSDLYFCESAEIAILMTEAGFGISILPSLFIPKNYGIEIIQIDGAIQLSFGLFYKTHLGNRLIKDFIRLIKEQFQE